MAQLKSTAEDDHKGRQARNMKKQQFLRIGLIIAAVAACVAPPRAGGQALGGNVRALDDNITLQPGTGTNKAAFAPTVVYPTGHYPNDVASVQAAIDRGGLVVLKAANATGTPTPFNFGPPQRGSGSVSLRGTVVVVGESTHSAPATISGGAVPFIVLPGADVTIAEINFDTPFRSGILLSDPASAIIAGNRITHVVGEVFISRSHPEGFTLANAIETNDGGTISILNNVIDDVKAQSGIGIEQFAARGRVQIIGNRVSGTNTIAIESSQSPGPVVIEDNVVLPGPERDRVGSFGVGIEVNGPGSFEIINNKATCSNPNGVCIFVFGTTSVPGFGPVMKPIIRDNKIEVLTAPPSADGIGFLGAVSGGSVVENDVKGSGEAAIIAVCSGSDPASCPSGNRFDDNGIKDFTGSLASVFFGAGTHENVFRGFCGKLVDNGMHNQIICEH